MPDSNKIKNKGDENIIVQGVEARDVTFNKNKYLNISGEISFENLPKMTRNKIQTDFYYRLNREIQGREFSMFLDEKGEFEKPFLFFVHGFHDDRHGGLIRRLCDLTSRFFTCSTELIDLDALMESQIKDKKIISYTLKSKILKKLEDFVKNKQISYSNFPKSLKTCEFIQEIPKLGNSATVFELTVYTKFWTKELLSILKEDVLNSLFQFSLKDKEKPIFIFIHLIYEPEKTGLKALFGNSNKKIEKEIETFCKKNKERTYLFKQLSKISYIHANEFLKDFEQIDSKKFIKDNEELSFDTFFDNCKDEIAKYYINEIPKAF